MKKEINAEMKRSKNNESISNIRSYDDPEDDDFPPDYYQEDNEQKDEHRGYRGLITYPKNNASKHMSYWTTFVEKLKGVVKTLNAMSIKMSKNLSTILKEIKPNYDSSHNERMPINIKRGENNSGGGFNGKDLGEGSNLIPMKIIFEFLNNNNSNNVKPNQFIDSLDKIDDATIDFPALADEGR